MATGVKSWSQTAATNSTADSNINWAEGQAPSTVNDSARYMMKAIADVDADTKGGTIYAGNSGTNTLALTTTQGRTLAAGQRWLAVISVTNTSTVAVTVDGNSAGALQYHAAALIAGDLVANDIVLIEYDGTNCQLLTPPRLSAAATNYSTDTTGGDVADLLYFADASQSNASNKVTVQKFFDVSQAALTAKSVPLAADGAMITDSAASNVAKSATVGNLFHAITGLTADGTGATGDKIPTYDVSASGPKYVLISTLQTLLAATQAIQETGTANTTFVTPGTQQYHPSACKAQARFAPGTASPTPTSSFNISGVTKNSTGNYTVTFTTAFSGATAYTPVPGTIGPARNARCLNATTTTVDIIVTDFNATAKDDSDYITLVCFGDQ